MGRETVAMPAAPVGKAARPFRARTLLALLIATVACLSVPVARADAADGGYIVTFAAGTSESDQAAAISGAGATDLSEIAPLRLHSISIPAGSEQTVVDALKADARVTAVDQDRTRAVSAIPSDPDYASQWSLPKIGWDNVFGSVAPTGNAKVAILDTGIDGWHPDLSANIAPGTSIIDPFSDGSTDPNGHGTEMAGIVAASADNGIGVAGIGYSGVTLMPVQVLDAQGAGQDSDIIQGIVWAADRGADVILMSFSNPGFSQGLQDAIDYAWSKGAVIVAATGNDGVSTPTFPAGDRGVVGVANTDASDALSASSNRGEDVFMAAPGTGIFTTSPGGYATISGTSPAAAAVAGAAALLKATSPDAGNGVIVGRLARNADATATSDTGNGRLNLERAIGDASSDPVEPSGATPVGDGGPLVGPYTASAPGIAVSPSSVAAGSSQSISVTTSGNWASGKTLVIKDNGVTQAAVIQGTSNPCVTPSNGQVTCTYTTTPSQGTHTVTAQSTSDGPTSATYVAFGAATQLVFTAQPASGSNTPVNSNLSTQPQLTLRDSDGNTVTNDTRPVTLAISAGTGASGASLSCTTNPVTPVNGIATFSGCRIDTVGRDYTLTATNATLTSAPSNAFNITQSAVSLPLRSGSTTGIRAATTPLTIGKAFGPTTTASTLAPNSGTGSRDYDYDFYSAPLTAPAVLSGTDTGAASISLRNNNPAATNNNIVFKCAATFYDYDPAAGGSGTQIVATPQSANLTVNAVGTNRCTAPATAVGGGGYTVPAGHLLKTKISVVYQSGGTGTGGSPANSQLLYNASSGAIGDTAGQLPSNANNTTNWQFGAFTQGPNITLGAGTATGGNALTSGNKVTVSYTRNGTSQTADVYDGTSVSDFVDAGSTVSFSAASSNSGASERWQANSAGTAPTQTVSSTGTSGVLTTYPSTATKTYYDQLKLTVSSAHDTPDSTGTAFGSAVASGGTGAFYDRGSTATAKLSDTSVTELGTAYAFTGWSGDATGANAVSGNITMDAAKTATATWDAVPTATVSLSSHSPKTGDTLTATATTADADALDTVALTYVWKVNGTVEKTTSATSSLTDTFDLGSAGNGDRGDTVTVEVTPKDNHNVSGSMVSDSATVANTAPAASDPVFDPVAPRTKDSLSASTTTSDADGDQVAVAWTWKVTRGATTCVVKTASSAAAAAGERSSSLDLDVAYHPSDADCGGSAIDPLNPAKGDTVTVEATPSDAGDSGTMKSSHVDVANTLPVVDSAAIDQSAPKTVDTLTISVSSHDDDGDSVGYDYQWQRKRPSDSGFSDISGETAATLDLGTAGNGDAGDQLRVQVTPKDPAAGTTVTSDPVTVANTAPAASDPVFDPVAPRTKDSLSASTTTSDADGDQVAVAWTWKVTRGATTCVVKTASSAAAAAGERSSSLDLDVAYHPSDADCGGSAIDPLNPAKGDTVTVEATPSDAGDSGTMKSSHVDVANTLPVVDSASLDHTSPKVTDSVSVSATSSDADGDSVSYDYQWQKQLAGGSGWNDVAGATSDTLAVSGNAVKGDKLRVQVTPKDGDGSGTPVLSDEATIANSAPTATLSGLASADEGQTKTYTFTTNDADGDTVSFAPGYPKCGTGGTLEGTPAIADGSFDCSFPDGPATPTVALKVTDSDGATSSEQTKEVTVANVAPSTPNLVAPAANAETNDNTPTFDWSDSTDPGADDVTYTLQAVQGSCDFSGALAIDESGLTASSFTPSSGLDDGTYCWRVEASDSDSQGSGFSSTRSVTIDTAAPVSHASSPQYNNGSSIPVDYTASDEATGLVKVELWAKGPDDVSYTKAHTITDGATSGSFSYAPSAQGSYRFYTIAEDAAGNREAVPTGADTVTVVEDSATLQDTVAPVTTDDGDGAWHNNAQTVTLSPSDPGASDTPPTGSGIAHTYYTVDSGSQQEGTSVQVDAPADHSNDGTHAIEYWSVDNATNAESHNSAHVLIDTRTPAPTFTAPSAGAALNSSTPTLSGAAGDQAEDSSHSADGGQITVNLWSGGSASGTPDRTLTVARSGAGWTLQSSDWDSGVPTKAPLADGTWTARAEQSDDAGNTGQSSTRTFTVDTVAPGITSVSDSPDATNSSSTIAYSLSENAKVTVKIRDASSQLVRTLADDASRSSGANSETWNLKDADGNQVPDGTYTYTVDARDAAGNDATQRSGTVKVDTAAPGISLTAVSSPTNAVRPALSGTAGNQAADGSHAADAATVTVKVYSGSDTSGSLVRTLTATRDGSGNWSITAGDWTSQVQPALSDGTYTAQAEQSDGAGNTGTSTARTFKVDQTAPAPTLTSPIDGTSVTTGTPTFTGAGGTQAASATASADSSTVTVKVYSGSTTLGGTLVRTLSATLDGAGAYSVAASPALPNGSYIAQAEQTDAAGNTGLSAAATFTVNTLNYNFTGFFQPVTKYDPSATTQVFNQVKAGAAVPVKFSLGGDKTLNIFESGYPASQVIPCDSTAQLDAVEQTMTAGGSSLSYDAASGQYTYVWKTDKGYSTSGGPCRQLVIKFRDGTYQRANFKFTK